jgi:hypothetical protein
MPTIRDTTIPRSRKGVPRPVYKSTVERIERNSVDGENGCRIWTGRTHKGYGVFGTFIAGITSAKVRAIKADERSSKKVAADYGVSSNLIKRIRRGLVWKHVAMMLLCISPALGAEYPEFDQAGNRYPEACRRDLSDVQALVVPVDGFPDPRMQALWTPSIGGRTDIILVSRRLSGWKYADAVHHEKCHALMAKLYPSTGGQWHR